MHTKLAHLILAHDNPDQLVRLVGKLSHESADIYIHLDAKADIFLFKEAEKVPGVRFVQNRTNVVWCEYSTIAATLIAMEEILAGGVPYSHINLLSGRDYPLQTPAKIFSFFQANQGKSFLWFERIFNEWQDGQSRIKYYYFGDYGFPGRYQLSDLAMKLMPARKLPGGLIAYGRSQWLTLTTESVRYVLDYVKLNPSISRFFRMTWAVDEVFFQTILCNSPLKDTLVNNNLRHIVLNKGFRPITFTMANANELQSCGKLYARKFDSSVDSSILDYIDTQLLVE